jgi:integrase
VTPTAPSRRPYRTGSASEVSPGVWRLRVMTRDPATSKPRQVSRTIHTRQRGAKREVQEALAAFAREAAEGRLAVRSGTLQALVEDWLALVQRDKAPTTYELYRHHSKKALDRLGDMRVADLTPHHLDRLYQQLAAEGLRPATVRLVHSILSASLKQGVKWGWIVKNPAADATAPTVPRREEAPPSLEDVKRLIKKAEADGDQELATAVALAAATGARRGELCGLRWGDINLATGKLTIERQVVRERGGLQVRDPKTKKARQVTLGPLELSVLAQYEGVLAERWGPGWKADPEGFILSEDGRRPLSPTLLSVRVKRLGESLDPPITVHLHQLRHFTATWMVGAGIDVRTIAQRLGHARTSMTLDTYAQALPEQDREAAEKLGRALLGP